MVAGCTLHLLINVHRPMNKSSTGLKSHDSSPASQMLAPSDAVVNLEGFDYIRVFGRTTHGLLQRFH